MAAINNIDRVMMDYMSVPLSGYICTRVLAASTAERVTIPAGAAAVLFTSTVSFVAQGGNSGVTAAYPTADTDDGTGLEINPTLRRLNGTDTHISVSAKEAGEVSLRFFRGQA